MNENKGKRIFIVSPFENRMAKRGTRLPQLADYLTDKGFNVEYVTTNFSHAYKNHFSAEEILGCQKSASYKLTTIPIPSYKHNVSVRRIYCNINMAVCHFWYLLKNVIKGDVVVVPSRPVELILCVALVARIKGAKVILDIRDIWPDALIISSKIKKAIFTIYCHAFLYPALRLIDNYVHIAPSFLDWLHRYRPSAISLFIPPGYDTERWKSMQPRHGLAGKRLSLVFVGLLQLQLDVMPILKALTNRPNINFTIIGDSGTGQRYQEVIAFISKHGMKNVEMKGRMEQNDVVEELKKHDIAVVPMITSSIPNKVFDAIAGYLPIIALGDNDCANFVIDQNIGWSVAFDGNEVMQLLDSISIDDIIVKQENLVLIRERWGRDVLFQDFLKVIQLA